MINAIFYFPESLTFEEYRSLFDSGEISKNTIVFAKAQKSIYMGGDDYSHQEAIPVIEYVKDGIFSVKTRVGNETVVAADFTANQDITDDITFIQGDNITLTTDTNNRAITISASSPSTPVDAYTKQETDTVIENAKDVLRFTKIGAVVLESLIQESTNTPLDPKNDSVMYCTTAGQGEQQVDINTFLAAVKKTIPSGPVITTYYRRWPGCEQYIDIDSGKPYLNKVYLLDGSIYVWNNEKLVTNVNVVSTEEQTLTEEQQTRALANISAIGYQEQELTPEQKEQVQANIGIGEYATAEQIHALFE